MRGRESNSNSDARVIESNLIPRVHKLPKESIKGQTLLVFNCTLTRERHVWFHVLKEADQPRSHERETIPMAGVDFYHPRPP